MTEINIQQKPIYAVNIKQKPIHSIPIKSKGIFARNILQDSEFDDPTKWSITGIGTITGGKFIKSGAPLAVTLSQSSLSFTSGKTYTFIIYVVSIIGQISTQNIAFSLGGGTVVNQILTAGINKIDVLAGSSNTIALVSFPAAVGQVVFESMYLNKK